MNALTKTLLACSIAAALAAPALAHHSAAAYDTWNVADLARDNGAPVALRDIGMQAADLDRACEIALHNQYPNPRALERTAIRALLQDAFEGHRPQAR